MLTPKLSTAKGLTFIELMIALTVNSILLGAILAVFLANVQHYRKTLTASQLNEELETAMTIMKADISRAGYWANAQNDVGGTSNNNPFQQSTTDIQVNAGQDCILFTYDYDANGSIAAISSTSEDEHYGFRLINQTLQTRPPGATFSCTASASNWENMTDPNIVHITNLSFTLNTTTITTGPATKGISLRSVDISITGQLANDATVTKTLTQHVRIRNDKFIP